MAVRFVFVSLAILSAASFRDSCNAEEAPISGSLVERATGEVIDLKSDWTFNHSALGAGRYDKSFEYGANYKLSFRNGALCWYNILVLENKSALSFNLRHGDASCPKGIFDKVSGSSGSGPSDAAAGSTPDGVRDVRPEIGIKGGDLTVVSLKLKAPIVSGNYNGSVTFNFVVRGIEIEFTAPFSKAKSTDEAIQSARKTLDDAIRSIGLASKSSAPQQATP